MRGVLLLSTIILVASLGALAPARAGREPVLVVPTRPDVPVIINGVDASWCVVEGDWGLDRPGAVAPVVTCPPFALRRNGAGTGYYPYTGNRPRAGRVEIQPPANRMLPPPAEGFHRTWSTVPDTAPVTEYAPFNPPPVILAPTLPLRPR